MDAAKSGAAEGINLAPDVRKELAAVEERIRQRLPLSGNVSKKALTDELVRSRLSSAAAQSHASICPCRALVVRWNVSNKVDGTSVSLFCVWPGAALQARSNIGGWAINRAIWIMTQRRELEETREGKFLRRVQRMV